MTTGQIKLLTLIFALVNVWLLFHIPAISEATLKFISVGEIPGTDKSLSPDVMLYLAIGSFVIAVVLVFWREFRKIFARRKKVVTPVGVAQEPTAPAVVQMPTPVVARPAVSRRTGKKPPVVRPQVFVAPRVIAATVASAERRTAKFFVLVRDRILLLSRAVIRKSKRLTTRVKRLAVRLWKWLVPQAKRAWTLLIRVAKAARLLVRDAWRWAEPRIRAIDRQIETQLRNNKTTADVLKVAGEVGATVAVQLRKLGRFAKTARDNARKAWRTTNH